ncbi:hypothetical protein NBRC116598_12830 [Pseudophaeobacter arcticus]|uniref:Uncharacterized protein n=1 Tax=Pseudophaeobacter arcticus TaxID=385492 RepID=A0ABQ0AIY8_9RHOB
MQQDGDRRDTPDNEDQQKLQRHCPLPDDAPWLSEWRCKGAAVKGGVGESPFGQNGCCYRCFIHLAVKRIVELGAAD